MTQRVKSILAHQRDKSSAKYPSSTTTSLATAVDSHMKTLRPAPQPSPWVLQFKSDGSPIYTRPLVGSELFVHRFSKIANGGFDVCVGVRFSSPLPKAEVYARARRALERLRFDCPLIAACITDNFDWTYAPVRSEAERKEWLDAAFVYEDREDALDVTAFIDSLTERGLPYEVGGQIGSVIFRCFLVAGPSSTFGLALHGPHALIDGWPSLNVLACLFAWMSGDTPLDVPPWGTEWENLPDDIVTATGGPCPTWDTDSPKLVDAILADMARESICLTPGPEPPNPDTTRPGDAFRIRYKFSEVESRAIVAAAKKNGCTVTHLLDAAHALALAAYNPPDPTKEVDLVADKILSLEPQLPKTYFASCGTTLPVRVRMTEILKHESEVERLVLAMKALKERTDLHLNNPAIYHLLAALQITPLPDHDPGNRSTLTNLAIIDKRLAHSWGRTAKGETLFEIDEFYLTNRMTVTASAIHAWTFRDRICIQIQSFSAWKDADGKDTFIRKFLDEVIRQIRLLI